jgi:C4-dicarboxylate transporter, DctM subunit
MIWTLGVLPVGLLLLGFPIFIVLLAAVTSALLLFMQVPLTVLHQTMFGALDSVALLAIPFFIYAGELMGSSSVARRLVDFIGAGVARMPGNLAVTTVGAATIFGAISGASAAAVATIGKVMLPSLRRAGYKDQFSAGLITAVGAIDIIIPPSIPMIVYGTAASESVPRLYAAGVLPGLLIAGLLVIYVMWIAKREGIGDSAAFDWRDMLRKMRKAAWALGAPVVILGGIYGGIFSPTESAAVACVYSALVTRFIYRELSWGQILEAASRTAFFTAQVLIIVACASVFAWLLTVNQVPATLVTFIKDTQIPTWGLLLAVNLLLLVVGCFLDPLSSILLLSPLLVPLVTAAGVDSVHFGIVVMVNLAIGLFHPPFGINIFVAQSALGLDLKVIYRGILPFLGLYLLALALITFIPEISLYSMRLFMR